MQKLKGKIALELTLEEVNHINALIERDKAKPVVEDGYTSQDEKIHTFYRCPVCEAVITEDAFCPKCGQRLDKENIAL